MTAIAPRRIAAKMSQQELADKIGVTRVNITRMEKYGKFPSVRLIPILAYSLDCTIEELFAESRDLPHYSITPKEERNNGA